MFWEGTLPFVMVLVVCMAGCLACGLLAARKGYNIYVWTAAGGWLVSFVVLAFLPFVNRASNGQNEQLERTGNWIGGALAVVSLVALARLIWEIVGG